MFTLVQNLVTKEIHILSSEDVAHQKISETATTAKQRVTAMGVHSKEWIKTIKKFILKEGNLVTPIWIAHFDHILSDEMRIILMKSLLDLEKAKPD